MEAPRFEEIAAHCEESQSALRDLNNANARETSFLTETDWAGLVAEAFAAICVSDAAAFLITFQQNANYHSPNFKWFQERRNRFVYVDRIVVDDSQRGRGLGAHLYRVMFDRARAVGHDRIVCEVNLEPPNPGSDAFHTKMGFVEVGRTEMDPDGKRVRYYEKIL